MSQSTLQVIQLADTWNTAGLTYHHLHAYAIHPPYILAKMRHRTFSKKPEGESHTYMSANLVSIACY